MFEITNPKILTLSLIYLTFENKLSNLESQVYLTWLSKLKFMSFNVKPKRTMSIVRGNGDKQFYILGYLKKLPGKSEGFKMKSFMF